MRRGIKLTVSSAGENVIIIIIVCIIIIIIIIIKIIFVSIIYHQANTCITGGCKSLGLFWSEINLISSSSYVDWFKWSAWQLVINQIQKSLKKLRYPIPRPSILPYSTIFMILYFQLCFMTNIKAANMKNTAGKSLAHSFFSSAMFRALIYCNMAHYSLLRDPLENIWYMIWRHLFDPWRHPFWPLVQNGPTVLSTFGGILINLTAPNCTKVLF